MAESVPSSTAGRAGAAAQAKAKAQPRLSPGRHRRPGGGGNCGNRGSGVDRRDPGARLSPDRQAVAAGSDPGRSRCPRPRVPGRVSDARCMRALATHRAPPRASPRRDRAVERARQIELDRLDLTELVPAAVRTPPWRGHLHLVTQAQARARGCLRGHGLRGGRGPRSRDGLVQLRRPQHPPGSPGTEHVGQLLPQGR